MTPRDITRKLLHAADLYAARYQMGQPVQYDLRKKRPHLMAELLRGQLRLEHDGAAGELVRPVRGRG